MEIHMVRVTTQEVQIAKLSLRTDNHSSLTILNQGELLSNNIKDTVKISLQQILVVMIHHLIRWIMATNKNRTMFRVITQIIELLLKNSGNSSRTQLLSFKIWILGQT